VNETIVITAVRPHATEEEVAALTTALQSLWPQPRQQRVVETNQTWRFSRRRWND